MRMLELNQKTLWYVKSLGEQKVVDEDGFYTGELETMFSEPTPIQLHLYPASGKILEESFGRSADLDFVTGTSTYLETDTLLFREEPQEGYDPDDYDLKIDSILESLNFYSYGLKGRR